MTDIVIKSGETSTRVPIGRLRGGLHRAIDKMVDNLEARDAPSYVFGEDVINDDLCRLACAMLDIWGGPRAVKELDPALSLRNKVEKRHGTSPALIDRRALELAHQVAAALVERGLVTRTDEDGDTVALTDLGREWALAHEKAMARAAAERAIA